MQDKNGDENFHLYATDVATRETKDLTPIEGVRAEIAGSQREVPRRNARRPQRSRPRYHDIWRINIQTGEKQLVQQNSGVAGYLTDDDYHVRMAMNYTPTGGQVLQVPGKRRRHQQVEGLPGVRPGRRHDQRPGRLRQDGPNALPAKTAATATRPACLRWT